MSNKNNNKRRKRNEGYAHKSPAVCIVAYDMNGRPMPDSHATEIVNTVTEIALRHGYLINFTRT